MLVLEDGFVYYGWSLYKSITSVGELVFNTGMMGYQEIITDPSYCEQIVLFTYPEMGNTGINNEDSESGQSYVQGIIFKNLCLESNHWRQKRSFIKYLYSKQIPHIYGIDTRMLTRHIRNTGTIMGCISNLVLDIQVISSYFKYIVKVDHRNLVQIVSTFRSYQWSILDHSINSMKNFVFWQYMDSSYYKKFFLIVIDYGLKYNMLRILSKYFRKIVVVPSSISYIAVMQYKPDGILLSNGPGNPSCLSHIVTTVQRLLLYHIPIFGICMGHQILGLALKLNTFKLKFGHRGLNHPVGYFKIIYMTSQNHGFALQVETISDIINWQINFNDDTLAAIVHRFYPCFSVQYHPEASPGPRDTERLFLHFMQVVKTTKQYMIRN